MTNYMNPFAIGLGITLFLFMFVILILAVMGLVFWLRYRTLRLASKHAMRNHLFGTKETGKLALPIHDHPYPAITTNFSKEIGLYAVDLIARVEKLFHQEHDKVYNLSLAQDLILDQKLMYRGHLFGLIAAHRSNGDVWIAFRGTNQAKEWTEDFKFAQAQYSMAYNNEQKPFGERGGQKLHCHIGFMAVYETFEHLLKERVENLRPARLIITGHSMGAAVATLAALRFGNEYPVFLYTFASPRVCDHIPDVMAAFWRIQNTSDPIPSLPLAVMPNILDPEHPLFFTHGGKVKMFTKNLLSLSNNHLLTNFVDALENDLLQE